MDRIDAHHHLWTYHPLKDSWITDDIALLRQAFMPKQLERIIEINNVRETILVQTAQTEAHNDFLLSQAATNSWIRGVVGWVDLQAENIEDRLAHWATYDVLKGFRHILQSEPERDLMLRPAFKRGIKALQQYGFTYDILIYADQLVFAEALVAAFPKQQFVLDHLAKPKIREKEIANWRRDLKAIARHQNLHCKVSGMVTEADWRNWKKQDFFPYLDTVVEAFGIDRIMWGSDWPVCLLAASYEESLGLVEDYFSTFSASEKEKLFSTNARLFYKVRDLIPVSVNI